MKPNLQPKDPLSQVVFVHDYVQLVFQDCGFSFFNRLTYRHGDSALNQGDRGFCDSLVSLIDHTGSVESEGGELTLRFSNGASVTVAKDGPGPEAWMFTELCGPTVVEQNA